MPKQYFDALYRDKPWVLDFIKKSQENNLKPISDYLDIVIREQEKRQVSTQWEPVNTKVYFIEPQFQILKLSLSQIITVDLSKYFIVLNCAINIKPGIHKLISDDKFINIIHSMAYENNQILLLSDSINQNNGYLSWKDQNSKQQILQIDLNRLEDVKSIHINENPITDYIVSQGVLTFSYPTPINYAQNITINSEIHTTLYKTSSYSDNEVYHKGQRLDIIKKKDEFFYFRSKSIIDSIFDKEGNHILFEAIKESPPKVFMHNDDIYEFRHSFQGTYELVSHEEIDSEILYHEQLPYKITKTNQTNPQSIMIRLLEDKRDDDDPSSHIKSRIDYFFEENVSELSSDSRFQKDTVRYEVVYSKKENRTMVLRYQEKNKKITYDELPKTLYLVYDTSQNKKQRSAINELLERPIPEHRKLLLLNERLEKTKNEWNKVQPNTISEWYVLKDNNRDGNETQRRFVEKALVTPDFAFLEGPPGSGKTTAILELILQLLKDGKRVLLSASTHVAIDNVLERIFDYRDQVHIQAIRIGKESNIYNYTIKKFTLSNLIDDSVDNKFLDVFLQSCNLVCGTTIGILQHPHLKYDKNNSFAPVEAEFDYLIIDESSKTTYQEFLVTAIRAKRWVLVGDIKQLPPYAEDFDLIQNFNSLMSTTGNTNLILGYLLSQKELYADYRVCIILTRSDMRELIREMIERKLQDVDYDRKIKFAFINVISDNDYIKNHTINLSQSNHYSFFHSFQNNILFVEEDVFDSLSGNIPMNFNILKMSNVTLTNQILNAHQYRRDFYKEKLEINERVSEQLDRTYDTLSKSWAEHIVWQLKRNFELRFVGEVDRHNVEPYLQRKNQSKFMERYELLYQIALPSILESFQKGIKLGRDYKHKNPTILNQGFPTEILKPRHEILEYQHRMHPDISIYPRKMFYDANALKDSLFIKNRDDWKYNPYKSHSVWLNIVSKSKEDKKNYNLDEVRVMMDELKSFMEWSRNNPRYSKEGIKIPYEVACLTFYRGQERLIREELKKIPNPANSSDNLFRFKDHHTIVFLQTVDKFQGREADITFISMVRRKRQRTPGFLDSPNRINVAMTRARYLRVIIGDYEFFKTSKSAALKQLAETTESRNKI